MELELKIKSKSKNELNSMLSDLSLRFIKDKKTISHELTYYYYLQGFYISLINNFIYNRNLTYEEKTDFGNYLSKMIDSRFTLIGTMDGDLSKSNLAFKEIATGILGEFTSDILNSEKTYDKDSGYWETNITYKIIYDKPMFYETKYYKIAYQYYLDDAFTTLFTKSPNSPEDENVIISKYNRLLSMFDATQYEEKVLENLMDKFHYYRLPKNDTGDVILDKPKYTNILSVLVTIPEEDSTLFNIKDFDGTVSFTEEILKIIYDYEYKFMHNIYQSIFNISLYRYNEKLSEDDYIELDDELNVILKKPLDKNGIYRVVIRVCTDLSKLYPVAIERAKQNYPEVINKITDLIKENDSNQNIYSGLSFDDRGRIFFLQRASIIAKLLDLKD
jgi:hypothetical protein